MVKICNTMVCVARFFNQKFKFKPIDSNSNVSNYSYVTSEEKEQAVISIIRVIIQHEAYRDEMQQVKKHGHIIDKSSDSYHCTPIIGIG